MEAKKAQLAVVEEHMQEKAEEWNLSKEAIEAAAQLMLSDGQSLPRDLDERGIMLLFLYAKGILSQKASEARKAEFAALLTPADNYEQSLQRLGRLVLEGERRDSVLDERNSFTDFLDSVPAWQDNAASYVAFRDDPRISCGLLGACAALRTVLHARPSCAASLPRGDALGRPGRRKQDAGPGRLHPKAQDSTGAEKTTSSKMKVGQAGRSSPRFWRTLPELEGFDCTSMVNEVVGQALVNRNHQ